MSNVYENDSYTVTVAMDGCLGEDGKYGRAGYVVTNKETGVVEHTTMVLPQALFQADAFNGALGQINEATADEDDIAAIVDESPILN